MKAQSSVRPGVATLREPTVRFRRQTGQPRRHPTLSRQRDEDQIGGGCGDHSRRESL
jgi:hypothetical protein